MRGIDRILPAPLQDRMLGNDLAKVDDPDLVGQLLDFDDTPVTVGDAVIIAADREYSIVADPALQLQNRIEAPRGERLQLRLLSEKGFGDDPCVLPWTRTLATVPAHRVVSLGRCAEAT